MEFVRISVADLLGNNEGQRCCVTGVMCPLSPKRSDCAAALLPNLRDVQVVFGH